MEGLATHDRYLLLLCLWREARGQSSEAKRAILHVIRNRMRERNQTAAQVILAPKQFSSFNQNDPNYRKFPMPDDPVALDCCRLIDDPGADPTEGANHYESCPEDKEPNWADDRRKTATIGPFEFYRL